MPQSIKDKPGIDLYLGVHLNPMGENARPLVARIAPLLRPFGNCVVVAQGARATTQKDAAVEITPCIGSSDYLDPVFERPVSQSDYREKRRLEKKLAEKKGGRINVVYRNSK